MLDPSIKYIKPAMLPHKVFFQIINRRALFQIIMKNFFSSKLNFFLSKETQESKRAKLMYQRYLRKLLFDASLLPHLFHCPIFHNLSKEESLYSKSFHFSLVSLSIHFFELFEPPFECFHLFQQYKYHDPLPSSLFIFLHRYIFLKKLLSLFKFNTIPHVPTFTLSMLHLCNRNIFLVISSFSLVSFLFTAIIYLYKNLIDLLNTSLGLCSVFD